MADASAKACIYVLAGTNGAGKSSMGGAMLRQEGVEYFNPDDAAGLILSANPGATQAQANSVGWHEGRRLLERAIDERLSFAFETTLGGRTITALLDRAAAEGIDVHIWYVGLVSPELHIARVRARVARGGHDIPEERIRERYVRSRLNLIHLLPNLTELFLYDNTTEADPADGKTPEPLLILHVFGGAAVSSCGLRLVPEWAKPIVAAALG
ncbi:MAG: zeta toxin family protein [Acidobacteria bacterium]|nr:zeta toxin family protein [Acidobacteriota bacterium]